ncbi:hypothetical protein U1Q18_051970 [Sarracenia purpurea var. burkii]
MRAVLAAEAAGAHAAWDAHDDTNKGAADDAVWVETHRMTFDLAETELPRMPSGCWASTLCGSASTPISVVAVLGGTLPAPAHATICATRRATSASPLCHRASRGAPPRHTVRCASGPATIPAPYRSARRCGTRAASGPGEWLDVWRAAARLVSPEQAPSRVVVVINYNSAARRECREPGDARRPAAARRYARAARGRQKTADAARRALREPDAAPVAARAARHHGGVGARVDADARGRWWCQPRWDPDGRRAAGGVRAATDPEKVSDANAAARRAGDQGVAVHRRLLCDGLLHAAAAPDAQHRHLLGAAGQALPAAAPPGRLSGGAARRRRRGHRADLCAARRHRRRAGGQTAALESQCDVMRDAGLLPMAENGGLPIALIPIDDDNDDEMRVSPRVWLWH